MAKIKGSGRREAAIPNASMSDIAFLLLLFFMVTTVFVKERKFWVQRNEYPTASRNIERVSRNESSTIYITQGGRIYIDDYPRDVNTPAEDPLSITKTMQTKGKEIPELQVCFRTHKDTKYQAVRDVMMLLQDADTRNVVFESQRKK